MKTFTEKEIVVLKEYLAQITGRPIPFAKQKTVFDINGKCQWCEEWEMIEMLKYLINGKENYYYDPPPNRLKYSTAWSKENVEAKVIKDLDSLQSIEEIIDYFKKARELFNGRI